MEKEILDELQRIRQFTILGAKDVLTLTDVHLLTGLSKSYLYKMCMNKLIPHWKSEGGKYTYFDKKEINRWMLHNRIKTQSEVEAQAVNYIVTGEGKKKGGKNGTN